MVLYDVILDHCPGPAFYVDSETGIVKQGNDKQNTRITLKGVQNQTKAKQKVESLLNGDDPRLHKSSIDCASCFRTVDANSDVVRVRPSQGK